MSVQLFGITSLLLLAVGLAFIPLHWPGTLHMTFSQHVARTRSARVYYIALFSVFIPLFAVYFWGWLVPHMGLPLWASLCMVVSLATQYACTYVPEIEGAKAKIHRLLAGISALLLIPVVSAVVLAKLHMGQAVVTAMLALLIMVGVFVLVMLQRRNVRHTLVAQIVYFAAFFVAVLEWFE